MANTAAKGKTQAKGSNLFALDHDAIRATLADANATLLARAEALAAALDRVPASLNSDDLVERARSFRAQTAMVARELRQARLQDGKPFREADAAVKAFFAEAEGRLARVEREVVRRLTEAALRVRPLATEGPAFHPATAEGDDRRVPVQALSPPQERTTALSAAAAIRLRWEVLDFDRATLDLEALRMFLTDAALVAACRKHLEENGPHSLEGATYHQVAVD